MNLAFMFIYVARSNVFLKPKGRWITVNAKG